MAAWGPMGHLGTELNFPSGHPQDEEPHEHRADEGGELMGAKLRQDFCSGELPQSPFATAPSATAMVSMGNHARTYLIMGESVQPGSYKHQATDVI